MKGDPHSHDFKAADYCHLAEECFLMAATAKDPEAAAELVKAGHDYLRRAAEWFADQLKKRVQFGPETWHALGLPTKDRVQDFEELADEVFADLLAKHGRPAAVKTVLVQSVAGMEKRPPAASVRRGRGRKIAGSDDDG
jgi:hypothetical protein